MSTDLLKKNPVLATTRSKVKSAKSGVSKETLALFDDESNIMSSTRAQEKNGEKKMIKSVKKVSKGEKGKDVGVSVTVMSKNVFAVKKPQEVESSKKTEETNGSTFDKKTTKGEAIEKIKNASIDSKQALNSEKKSSLFSSFFSGTKTKDEKKENSSDTLSIQTTSDKVTISAPVAATPVSQRKLTDQKKLSTFGLSKERDLFIENLSMLVLAGMSIVGALASIIKQTKSAGMKAILERILQEIEAGSPVWKSLDKTGFFKGYTISLIRLGEESGNFAENLKVVALEEEKDREFKSKVKSALMYPVFVLVLTGVVGIGISWFILPKLAKIFYDLKLALPLITKVLLAFGLFLSKYGLVAVPLGAIVISVIAYIVFFNAKTKFLGEAIIFSIPGIKTLLMEVEVARFGYLLGTLLDAGLPITKAIDSLAGASEVIRYKKFYVALRESIDAGNSFQKSFALYKDADTLVPQPIQQLIFSGEQSGNLNKTLIKVGQVLEAKSDTTTKNLTIIMEPILLVIVWAGVVSVAFAVILPIYSLVGGLNTI